MVIIHGFDKVRSKDKSINQRKFQNPNILNPACISQLSGCGEPLKSVQRCPQLCWNPCVICWVFPENLFPLPPAKSKSCPQSKEKWICFIQMIKWKWEMCERWPSLSGSGVALWGKWIQHPHYGTELCASQACVGFCPWWSLWYPPRVYYTCLIVTQLAAKLPNFITSQLKWHSCHCYLLPVWERKREREREREKWEGKDEDRESS
jgi:hypothetical protein